MGLIDADVMREEWLCGENEYVYNANSVLDSIDEQPTVDAVEVVRCKDCIYASFYPNKLMYECGRYADVLMFPDDYCSYGKRREE